MTKNIVLLLFISFHINSVAQNIEKTLISDFKQGNVIVPNSFKECTGDKIIGNCVAIALIKTALAEFKSVEKVFRKMEKIGNITYITFYDGDTATVTLDNIRLVKDNAGILSSSDSLYYNDAVFLYACMCKKYMNYYASKHKNAKCFDSFVKCIYRINSGYTTKIAHHLLGLSWDTIPIQNIHKYSALVIYSNNHTVYCANGEQDLFGEAVFIKNGKMYNSTAKRYRKKIKGAFRLKTKY